MATSLIEERIERARQKLEKIKAENLAKLEAAKISLMKMEQQKSKAEKARLAALSSAARKLDTRKKILLGSVVFHSMESGKLDKAVIQKLLDASIVRSPDRAMFGLAPRPPVYDVDTGKDTHA